MRFAWKAIRRQAQRVLQCGPFEAGSGIKFSTRCDVFMPRNMRRWVVLHEGCAQACQRVILTVFEDCALDPLKLDTYRMVIAVATALITRNTGVPRALITADKLPKFTLALDVKVGRHLHAQNGLEVGVFVPVKLIGKQALDLIATVLSWWQADRVQHDQIRHGIDGTWPLVGGAEMA